MAKKNKKNVLQLIAKKRQLQALEQGYNITIPETSQLNTATQKPALPPVETIKTPRKALVAYQPGKEIWRTVVTVVIIALILSGLVVADSRYHFLDGFGNRLYNSLKLNG